MKHLWLNTTHPILFRGDFNKILTWGEKEGGASDECELWDLGYIGQWFTWEMGLTVHGRVREQLDRFLGSPSWFTLYPDTTPRFYSHAKSQGEKGEQGKGSSLKLAGCLTKVVRK
ncbi:Tol-Pal system protein TolB [Bienertia sinuspersici]